ncbi:pyridoxal phosphate phosphatase PHOSPHO2 isoform X1 [Cherax quadricarinatus]|uniref:pyridoxal phosphate phosphatase PHOSPHO2 isoform X1 n=2 Tax=Cherax quadricarinatus TaxID=27406 RepID=UPI002378BD3E|nr:pyridoxal phosphate phosphatase PHOSPHO2-like isoform X1 [Cherax quadricarinatus]
MFSPPVVVPARLFFFYYNNNPARLSPLFFNTTPQLHTTLISIFRRNKMETKTKHKVLLALDFDHTVIDNNSDTYIYKLAPDHKIPDDLKLLYRRDNWTHYMGEVFKFLYKNGVTKERIFNCLKEIKLTDGMKELLTGVPRDLTEFIIISDGNSVFIDHILKSCGLRDLFSELFTNPAQFDDNGCLHIQMYHLQDWCTLSTKNLCKGDILSNYIKLRENNNVTFSTIAYVGDGTNDFCPSLRLKECDVVFPRCGYNLLNYIPKMEAEKGMRIEADVCPWDSGKDILERLLLCYSEVNASEVPKPRLKPPLQKL